MYTAGRQLSQARRAKDFIAIGSDMLKLQGTIDRWAERRLKNRSMQEIWEDPEVTLQQGEDPEVIPQQAVDSDDDMYSDWDLSAMQID